MAVKDPLPFSYPKIPYYGPDTPDGRAIAFEKYDGTCLAWHWKAETGFVSAMTRRYFLDDKHPVFGEALKLFQEQYASKLDQLFRTSLGFSEVGIFAEFFGPNSFAGFHEKKDNKQLVFLDVWLPIGMLGPELFIQKLAPVVPIPKVVFQGKITRGSFYEKVKKSHYPVGEGVVCKGGTTGEVWMCKIKTQKWLDRLKTWTENNPNWVAPDEISRSWEEEDVA